MTTMRMCLLAFSSLVVALPSLTAASYPCMSVNLTYLDSVFQIGKPLTSEDRQILETLLGRSNAVPAHVKRFDLEDGLSVFQLTETSRQQSTDRLKTIVIVHPQLHLPIMVDVFSFGHGPGYDLGRTPGYWPGSRPDRNNRSCAETSARCSPRTWHFATRTSTLVLGFSRADGIPLERLFIDIKDGDDCQWMEARIAEFEAPTQQAEEKK